jgi:hypothetical protein
MHELILLIMGSRLLSSSMEQLPGLPPEAFDKEDPSPDAEFYDFPRFVTHIDDGAIAYVTRVYRETLPPGGTILDLMSSWVSHLPEPGGTCRKSPALSMVRAGPECQSGTRVWRS